jgi:O-antigen/teichoic acid export membrane protein
MTVVSDRKGRLKPIVLAAWPILAFVVFAALAVAHRLPTGYVRAAAVLPIILLVPGALAVCAIFGQRRRPLGVVFTGYAMLLSVALLAFVSLGLYMLHILITATSTYWALLVVCSIFAVVAESRLLSESRTSDWVNGTTGNSPNEGFRNGSNSAPSGEKGRPLVVLGGTIAGLILLFGGVYYYEHVPHPASPGYTELAWTNAGQRDTVAVGPAGTTLKFEVISQQSTRTRFRLTAEWEGAALARRLAAPITFSMGPNVTYNGSLFVPPPADGCMYRVVVSMVAIGQMDPLTGHQASWSINANVHKQGSSGNACLYFCPFNSTHRLGLAMADIPIRSGGLQGMLRTAAADSLVRNSLYLMGSTITTAGLGYIYWVVAAHIFAKQSVGASSAVVSMYTTISLLTYLGPYAMLIELLPRSERSPEWTRILYRVCSTTAFVTCAATTAVAPVILASHNYRAFYTGLSSILVVLAGAGSTTLLNLLGSAFIAARRASQLLVMQTLVSVAKLILLFPFANAGAIGLVETWVISSILGVAVGVGWLIPQMGLGRKARYKSRRRADTSRLDRQGPRDHARHRRGRGQSDPTYMRRLVGQHLTSVGGMLTPLLLPVLVVMRLGAVSNADFYVTWMVGSVFFMVSPSLSTAVFAEGVRVESNLSREVFKALRVTAMLLAPAIIVMTIGGRIILGFFGASYAKAGYELLIVLAISAIPDAVSNFAVSVWRITHKLGYSAALNLGILVTALAGAWVLMPRLGINGTGIAWGGAQLLGAIASLPAYRHMHMRKDIEPFGFSQSREIKTSSSARSLMGVSGPPRYPSAVSQRAGIDALIAIASAVSTGPIPIIPSVYSAGYGAIVRNGHAPRIRTPHGDIFETWQDRRDMGGNAALNRYAADRERGPVVKPGRGPDVLAAPFDRGVVDPYGHRLAGHRDQIGHQAGDVQSQFTGAPLGASEEPVRSVVRPQPRQARPGQHPAQRALPGLREEPAGQHSERAERRGGEQRPERDQAGWPAKRETVASHPGASPTIPAHGQFLGTRATPRSIRRPGPLQPGGSSPTSGAVGPPRQSHCAPPRAVTSPPPARPPRTHADAATAPPGISNHLASRIYSVSTGEYTESEPPASCGPHDQRPRTRDRPHLRPIRES